MSNTRAAAKDPTGNVVTSTHVTTYEISIYRPAKSSPPNAVGGTATRSAWEPQGTIQTSRGAPDAIRLWAEKAGEAFTGGTLRAVPTSRITERDVTVETKRQLTLGAP